VGRKNKRAHWAELETIPFVFQPPMEDVFEKDFHLKGKWNQFFGNSHPIVLELGCGKGEYTVGLAGLFHDQNFIGVDIKGARMWRGATTARDRTLTNVAFIRTRIEWITSFFSPGEIHDIWLTFPDPQPKKRQAKKRLTHPSFLSVYRRMLLTSGPVHLKTDNTFLYEYTRKLIEVNQLTLLSDIEDLYHDPGDHLSAKIQTFYEQNFLEQGMKIHYVRFSFPHNNPLIDLPDEE
jgi:tRNA (guanine-N7-)-methyltransferase